MVRRAVRALVALAAAGIAGCGPYTELGQRLDVAERIVGGDSWIAAVNDEVRILLLGKPGTGGGAPFAFTTLHIPVSAGVSGSAIRGTYTEDRQAGSIALAEKYLYVAPDESGVGPLSRHGTTRDPVDVKVTLSQSRSGGRLVLSGDPSFAATYLPLESALAGLGNAAERDADCLFQLGNLAVMSSSTRILGFGSATMTQYYDATAFVGIASGDVVVKVDGTTVHITYDTYSDFGGIRLDGMQTSYSNWSGDGRMEGVVRVTLSPKDAAGGALPAIAGGIDYGGLKLSNGSVAAGSYYVMTLDGIPSSWTLPALTAPSPSVKDCLALP